MLFCSIKLLRSAKVLSLQALYLVSVLWMNSTNLIALPTLDRVANGDVSVTSQDGIDNSMQVNQNSDKAIINWHDFNIGEHERVFFNQPANGICLNRVDGANGVSQIAGRLNATGNILLINQAGVMFAKTAKVRVGGIIAATADISDQNFLDTNVFIFDIPSSLNGAILNHGFISVRDHGLAALLGASVSNEGFIVTQASQVLLQSGSTFTIDFNGDGLINFAVNMHMPQATAAPGVDGSGVPLNSGVSHTGHIINDQGNVIILAHAAPEIFDNLINMNGTISARHVQENRNGVILVGDQQGAIHVAGKIDVSGVADNSGGGVVIIGNKISNYADIDVSGEGSGWITFATGSGEVYKYDMHSEKSLYVSKDFVSNLEPNIPTVASAIAIKNFYDYKSTTTYTAPISSINIVKHDNLNAVSIDFTLNGRSINLRSILPEDYETVYKYLNSQPLARAKYAHGQTVSLEDTISRVKTLADRFRDDVIDGCYMHGGFIISDKETGTFLGMANSGYSGDAGITEIAYLYRPDVWGHKPQNLTDYQIPSTELINTNYQGLGSAVVSALTQYTEHLKIENHTIKGDNINAIRATTRTDNPGSWKALAKNDFELKGITINPAWGHDLRYKLEYEF